MTTYLVEEKCPGDMEPDRTVNILKVDCESVEVAKLRVEEMNKKNTSSWDNYFKLIGIAIQE